MSIPLLALLIPRVLTFRMAMNSVRVPNTGSTVELRLTFKARPRLLFTLAMALWYSSL